MAVPLANISEGRMAPVSGGVLVRDPDGHVIGSVGISGDVPDQDEACAVFAINAIGLRADCT